jgi:hypothetical protein
MRDSDSVHVKAYRNISALMAVESPPTSMQPITLLTELCEFLENNQEINVSIVKNNLTKCF